jgi:ligand-binding sensor domain-containing protein
MLVLIKVIKVLLPVLVLLFFGCENNQTPATPTRDEPEAIWTIYNTANSALPDNQINSIVIDRHDTKWLGTANGLVRIQNLEWTVFNSKNSGLPADYVSTLAVEENGTLWIGTDKGLARFDGKTWSVYNSQNSILTNNSITSITHDPPRGITWIGTDEGLIKTDKNGHWEYISVADNTILSLTVDRNGALWAGIFKPFIFRGQINKYANGRWTFHNLHEMGFASAFPYDLAIDKDNAVVAVLAGTVVKTVLRITDLGWEEITGPENARGLKTILVEGNKIWVGGNSLCVFGNKNAPCLNIPGQETHIRAMAMDSRHRKWLGTLYEGLAIYSPAEKNKNL